MTFVNRLLVQDPRDVRTLTFVSAVRRQTFAKRNDLYSSGNQVFAVQLVAWMTTRKPLKSSQASRTAQASRHRFLALRCNGLSLLPYVRANGQNLMSFDGLPVDTNTLDLCSFHFRMAATFSMRGRQESRA